MQLISNGQKKEEFTAWLILVACRMNEAMSRQRDKTARNAISKAKQYIQEYYQNPDLSVEMLCRELHM
ncbi:DNA-binding response regulator, partial [Klebsiella oxytoca]